MSPAERDELKKRYGSIRVVTSSGVAVLAFRAATYNEYLPAQKKEMDVLSASRSLCETCVVWPEKQKACEFMARSALNYPRLSGVIDQLSGSDAEVSSDDSEATVTIDGELVMKCRKPTFDELQRYASKLRAADNTLAPSRRLVLNCATFPESKDAVAAALDRWPAMIERLAAEAASIQALDLDDVDIEGN